MKTLFPVFVLALAAVIAVALFLVTIAQAEQSSISPFTVLSTSPVPPGIMLARGGHHGGGHHGGGHHMSGMSGIHHGHHFHHRFHHHRHFFGDGGWYGSAEYGGGNCWLWDGYTYRWICPEYDTY